MSNLNCLNMSSNRLHLCQLFISLIIWSCLKNNCLSGQYIYTPSFSIKIDPDVSMKSLMPFTNFVCGKKALCNVSNSRFECPVLGFTCEWCSCDTACLQYGTCCFDVYEQHSEIPPGNTHARCVSAAFKKSLAVQTVNYTMIAICPRDKDESGNNRFCLNPDPNNKDHFVPVQGNISGQELTFRNSFCARCHGLNHFKPWVIEYTCSGLVDYSQVRSEDDYNKIVHSSELCAILSKPYEAAVTSMCGESHQGLSIVSTCKTGFSDKIRRVCESLHHVVTIKSINRTDTSYKNEYCAYCNNVSLVRHDRRLCPTGSFSFLRTAPLSVLFDFNKQTISNITVQERELIKCDTDKVYDPVKKFCRPIYCPAGMLIHNHTCKDLVTSAFGVGYRLAYNVVPTKQLKIPTRKYDKNVFVYNYITNVDAVLAQLNSPYSYHAIRYSYKRDGQFIIVKNITVYTKLVPAKHQPRQLVEKLLNDVQKTTYYWYLDNDPKYTEVSKRHRVLLDETIDQPFKYWSDTTELDRTEVRVIYSRNKLGLILPIYRVSDKYFKLVTELLSCPMILLNKSEFIVVPNDAILVDATNTTYKPGQYRLHNHQVYICTSYQGSYSVSRNKTITNPYLNIDYEEVILTIVCITLSLIGLAITLITYALLPSLRTFPGKNNMILFSIMFVAQLMFMSTIRANVTATTCSALGAINHYLFLTLFFWKSVCAFHMYRLFCHPMKFMRQTKWLFIYVLYSFLSPLLIIGLYVIVNLTTSGWTLIGYGGNICFLSTALGIGVAFALPVAVILTANVVLFIFVIRALNKTRKKMEDATRARNKNHTIVYFKMSLLLGFTWAVGFVAAGTGTRVLWYLFSFLNSIIGLFICITYVFKRDIIDMLRRRLTCKRTLILTDSSKVSYDFAKHATILTDTGLDSNSYNNRATKDDTHF